MLYWELNALSDHAAEKKISVKNSLFVILLAVFLAAGVLLILHLFPFGGAGPVVPPVSSEPSAPPTQSTGSTAPTLPKNPKDFAALQAENPEIVAWISIPGTVIDYPIMQSGEDREENYYLTRRPDGSKHKEGSIYIQKINQPDFSDPNTVIYGHNMASGRMFAAIHKFKKADFFEKNQYIYIYSPGQVLTYRIYSLFVYDDRHILNSFNFFDDEEYAAFLEQTLDPTSMIRRVREGVEVTTDDYIITLSTCTNRDKERLLLEGVLVDVRYTQ